MSRAEQSSFARDDEECLAKVYFVLEKPVIAADLDKKTSGNEALREQLEQLSAFYTTEESVEEFLRRNEFLFLPLLQALDPLRDAFGKLPKIRLELIDEGASQQLFAVIATSLKPETALIKLNTFDKNWWFKAPPGIHDVLEFTVEFV